MLEKLKKLRKYNGLVGVILLAQGVVMWFLTGASDFKLPITTNYLSAGGASSETIRASEGMFAKPTIEHVADVQVGYIVAAFLLLSGLFLLGSAYVWRKKYEKELKNGVSPFRWIEYSITSSLMVVVIAMLCGIYDLSSLVLLFSLNACMIFFGWVMELHNQNTEKVNWTSYIFGCFAGLVPWIVMGLYFYNAISSIGDGVPTFVYWIFFTLFAFFNIFAFNMILQYKKVGKWKDYIYGERVYVTLSLVAKALLAWQVWGGTMR